MSDAIRINRIHGFGYHGVFEEERKTGQDFYVDVLLELNLQEASRSDDLTQTINYAKVCDCVLEEIVGPPFSLIEALAGAIADRLLTIFPLLNKVVVTVHKPQAPVAVEVLDISVSIERFR